MIDDNVKNELEQLVKIFNHGAAAYKLAQQLIVRIDDRVHNEFAYFSRAVASVLEGIIHSKYDDSYKLATSDALGAARHILNDCLDLIVSYSINESLRLKNICLYTSIQDIYPDYHSVRNVIEDFSPKISQSRKNRGFERIDMYIEMVESDDYQLLIKYCNQIPTIEESLKKKKASEVNQSKVVQISVILALVSILFGALSIFWSDFSLVFSNGWKTTLEFGKDLFDSKI